VDPLPILVDGGLGTADDDAVVVPRRRGGCRRPLALAEFEHHGLGVDLPAEVPLGRRVTERCVDDSDTLIHTEGYAVDTY